MRCTRHQYLREIDGIIEYVTGNEGADGEKVKGIGERGNKYRGGEGRSWHDRVGSNLM